jgi:MerR family transcriptional regulator/heat shock protein HspR
MTRINAYTRSVSSSDLLFISVAARMLDMHPQTLRKYERLGLVRPARTIGSMRLYSSEEIERLRFIKRLVEEDGVNLAGVQRLRPLLNEGLITRDAGSRRRLLREVAALDDLLGLGEA